LSGIGQAELAIDAEPQRQAADEERNGCQGQ
jgi:hypothetical protein